MLKTLLFQLMSLRIGDIDLFIAIYQAFTESKTISSTDAQEERLWEALRQALNSISSEDDEVAIIVDGLDEMEGLKPAAKQVSAKLQAIAQDAAGLRVLLFSQPLDIQSTESVETVELSIDNVYEDIQTILQQGLLRYPHFSNIDPAQQDSIVDGLLGVSDGSMLLATLLVGYLAYQKTDADFGKAVEAILKSPPRNVAELIQRYLGVAKLDSDSKTVISLLASVKRPLSLKEIEVLLRTDPKNTGAAKPVQLGQIMKSIATLIVTAEGLVSLRHDAVKQAVLNIPDTSDVSLHLKDRHKDILVRLFSSAGKYLRDVDEPRLDFLSPSEVDKRLASHRLLEYTIRYWAIHFKLSSLYKVQGDLQLPQDFASVFPASVSFALLEASCWKTQCLPDEVVELLNIAYRVRKQLFGLEHVSVIQSAITSAVFYDTVLSRYPQATQWYALVVRIGTKVLGLQSEIVVTCCNTLLQISETLITTKRTEIMTYREEVLQVLISSYTHQYGASSTEVLKAYETLTELYVHLHEETKVKELEIKIRGIRTGSIEIRSSTDHDRVSRHLDVMLKKHSHEEQVEGFESLLFGYEEETEESWTILHVESMIKFALELIKRGKFSSAEEIYVELLLKLSDQCQSTQVTEWHEKRIEVMLKYATFLHTQKRTEEASAVLICCWSEYSTHHVSMFESIILLLKEVAVTMKTVGMTSLSLTVFQRCWSWFKSTRKEESSVFKEIVEQIAITSSQVVQKSSTTTTTTTTAASETVIREVFESIFSSSSEETQVTTTTMELCNSLTSIYIEQEKWSEAVSVIKSTLKRTSWASFFSESIDSISLESKHSSESIKLVLDLAQCYINQKRYDRVEHIYLRLYRIHTKSLKFDDAAVIKYRQLYIDFLTKYEMHSVLIAFYQELLVEYRSFYGPAHAKTIAILYALGDVCRNHHLTHGYWIEYYSEIIVALNKDARICHEDALRALIVVAEYYYDLQRYSEALVYLKSIIATFCQFGTKYKYFQDTIFVQKTFERYYRVIEETQVEIHERVKILKEIREACSKYFSESSEVSLSVTVTLAEVCTKSEKYEYEAVSYYEHILKHSKTISSTTVKRSQSTLRTLYVKQITSTKSSTTVTTEMIEKATTMTYERYVDIRKTHSCTHETTLTTLKELVVLYQKQKRTDLAIKELQGLIVECVVSTSSTKELIETAKQVASIFAGTYVSQGVQLIRELKLQVIYKIASKTAGFNVTKAGRSSFAFIANFEYYLNARSGGTIAGYMAEILAEYLFYERLVSSVKTKTKIGVVLLLGARLRNIHYRTQRAEDFEIVERQVLDYFNATEVTVVKDTSKSAVRGFVRILLRYFSERGQPKNFVASAARAAVSELKVYLANVKYAEALGLAQCIYKFLMAHEGLDDPTEITLGFQLCLMMAGRGEYKRKSTDEETNKAMLALSHAILGEVFDICKSNKIDLFRCPLHELNELISLLGDQKDSRRLLWLLESLWTSRGGQSWDSDVKLTMGTRLVQARFVAGDIQVATRLAEDIVYNLRRTNGPRHKQTLAMYELLASMYTSAGYHFTVKSSAEKASEGDKKRDAAQARSYFKKAVTVNEDILKVLVEIDADNSDDDDDDTFSVTSGSHHGSVKNRSSGFGLGRSISKLGLRQTATGSRNGSSLTETEITGSRQHEAPREVLVEVARKHLRLAKLAVQRYGGWDRLTGRRFENVTTKIWKEFGPELKLKDDQVLSSKWKVTGFGNGKAEGGIEEDGFAAPSNWAVC
jgi:tetratricopeptide (TPR) repeat protein